MGESSYDGHAVTEPRRPSNYALVLPAGWHRIDLDRRESARDIEAILSKQFVGHSKSPLGLQELRSALLAQAAAARAAGGVELCLSMMEAPPLAVPAALLTSILHTNGEYTDTAALAGAFERRTEPGDLRRLTLPAGEALLWSSSCSPTRRPRSPLLDELGSALFRGQEAMVAKGFSRTFYILVPEMPGTFLSLCFSSPVMALFDPLSELFDTIAETLRWVP